VFRMAAIVVAALGILGAGLVVLAGAQAPAPPVPLIPAAGGGAAAAPAAMGGPAATPAGTAGPATPAARPDADKTVDVADAARVFQELFGDDIQRAAAGRDHGPKVELAARMLVGARTVQNQPVLLAMLCEKACELGLSDPRGFETVLASADLLAARIPEKVEFAQEMRIAVRQAQNNAARTPQERRGYGAALVDLMASAANGKAHAGRAEEAQRLFTQALQLARALRLPVAEIEAQQKAAAELQRTAARLALLKAQVKAEPNNQAAREQLVRALVVDFDDPAEAARYLDGPCDAVLLKYVPAAAKGAEAAPELACLELGKWYRDLAASASAPAAKAAMLSRTQAYCERFLQLHVTADIDRAAAELMLRAVGAELPELAASAAPLARNLVLGVWLFRRTDTPLLDSRKKPVALQGEWKWAADDAFARPTETVEFRKATANWPNEPAFQIRAGSITAWVRPTEATGGIATKGSVVRVEYSLLIWGGKPGTSMGWPEVGQPTLTAAAVPLNRWTFLAYAWNDRAAEFWLDGKPVGIVMQGAPLRLSEGGFEIGDNSPGGSQYFVGRMAAVHLYNAIVTDSQVQDLMRYEAKYMKLRLPPDAAPPSD